MTYEERIVEIEKLEQEAKSWGASDIIPWRRDYLEGGGVTVCFDNGYCADFTMSNMSYGGHDGLFEMAIMSYIDHKIGDILYDTPITDDVVGHLSIEECKEYCQKIKELSPRNK